MGERLRKLLEAGGMTQTELAKKLDISLSTLNGYITGYREPDVHMLSLLARELGTTTDYLITGSKAAGRQKSPLHEKVKLIAHNEGVELTQEQEAAVARYMRFLIAEDDNK